MAGLETYGVRVLSLYCLFSPYAMADLNPPPLFSPANAGGNVADSGGVTIIHGEIPSPVVDPEVVPRHIHPCVEPHPDTTSAQDPSPPVHEPNLLVRPWLSL